MEKKLVLNYENMPEYFRQTADFIFLDKAEIVPGISAEGMKLASAQDWYFGMHFPGNPVMPGVFQMEALMQTGGLIINAMEGKKELTLMFGECKSVRIRKSVRPGDVLKTNVVLQSYRRGVAWFQAEAETNGEVSCTMQFSLVAPSEMHQVLADGIRKNPEDENKTG